VGGENEDVAHGANRTMTISARKTAPHWRIPSYYEFAPHHQSRSSSWLNPPGVVVSFTCRDAKERS